MAEVDESWKNALDDLWTAQSRWSNAAGAYKKGLRSWTGPLILAAQNRAWADELLERVHDKGSGALKEGGKPE